MYITTPTVYLLRIAPFYGMFTVYVLFSIRFDAHIRAFPPWPVVIAIRRPVRSRSSSFTAVLVYNAARHCLKMHRLRLFGTGASSRAAPLCPSASARPAAPCTWVPRARCAGRLASPAKRPQRRAPKAPELRPACEHLIHLPAFLSDRCIHLPVYLAP